MKIIETEWKWKAGLSERKTTDYIVLHHAAAAVCTAAQVDKWHKENGWSGIGYHFFVRKDGSIYRGRPLNSVGAHSLGMNTRSVGVCAEGNYDKELFMPKEQKTALKELCSYLKELYPNARAVGHRELNATGCPGAYYPLEEIKEFKEGEVIDMKELNELKAQLSAIGARLDSIDASFKKEIGSLKNPMIYNYVDDNMPLWAREGVLWCIENGIITGTDMGLGLDGKDLRYCTVMMRMAKLMKGEK